MVSRNYGDKDGSRFPLYLSVFVGVLGFSLVTPIFLLYAIGLGASYTLLGFIISVYGAVQLITQILIGRSSDKRGRKPPGGVGASAAWPLAMTLKMDKVRSESREAAMGRYKECCLPLSCGHWTFDRWIPVRLFRPAGSLLLLGIARMYRWLL